MAALLSEQGKILVFARSAAFALIVFTILSEILLRPNVVPSDEYIESTWLIYFLIISVFGVINFLAIEYYGFSTRVSRKVSRFQYFSSWVASTLVFVVCFQIFLQSSLPSVVLRFIGSHTVVELEVREINPNRDIKFCVRGVFLRNKPYFADEICNIDPSVLRTLSAGDLIVVSGNGNWMGLIPRHVAHAP